MLDRFEKFDYQEWKSDPCKVFFLDKATGEIWEFYTDYNNIPTKFNTRVVAHIGKKVEAEKC